MANEHPHPTLGETITGMELPAAAALAGLVLVAIGSLGPWVTAPLSSASGLDGDGKLTVILAAFGAVQVARRRPAGVAIASLLIAATGVYDAIHIHHVISRSPLLGARVDRVGWGVYAVIVGAAVTLLAVYHARRQSIPSTLRGWMRKK